MSSLSLSIDQHSLFVPPRIEWLSLDPLRFMLLPCEDHECVAHEQCTEEGWLERDDELGIEWIVEWFFVFDGASWLRPHVFGKRAPLSHDWLYRRCGRLPDETELSRRQCDLIFYRLCRDSGVPFWRAQAGYAGVRLGGWRSWRHHMKRIEREGRS